MEVDNINMYTRKKKWSRDVIGVTLYSPPKMVKNNSLE